MSDSAATYKDTLTLPQTTFPMRGDLVENEPKRLERWENDGLYQKIIARRRAQNAPEFILHDGPPFANGDVHMGTALNKLLKDLVVKSKTMAGFTAPFVPGWDCHGLPIEFKVVKEAAGLEPAEIRRRCAEFASKFIDIQRGSFRRLGVFGDWENPYLTMDPGYEADILRVFAKLVENGCVYQSQEAGPVVLRRADRARRGRGRIQGQGKPGDLREVPADRSRRSSSASASASIVIWTTTPWTLPANLGIAVHPEFTYVVGRFENEIADREETLVIVRELIADFQTKTGFALAETLAEIKGRDLEGLEAQHPFLDRTSKVILANFVTTETGTGAVHIAPGHGADDYVAGQQNGLGVLSPVDDDGNFTAEVGLAELVGVHVFKSNDRIIEILAESGHLLGQRGLQALLPALLALEDADHLPRRRAVLHLARHPARPGARRRSTRSSGCPPGAATGSTAPSKSRPDWCISRQRTWGVPLPVFFDENGEAILSAELARKVADLVETEGTNVWFEHDDAEIAARARPARRRDEMPRHARRLDRLRLLARRRARPPPRAPRALPISIWKPPTSTAAGSRARSCSASATAAPRPTRP